jgi:hypothetical protein
MSRGRVNLSISRLSNRLADSFTSKNKGFLQILAQQKLLYSEKRKLFSTDSDMFEILQKSNAFFLKYSSDTDRLLTATAPLFNDEESLRRLMEPILVKNVPSSYSVLKLFLECQTLKNRILDLLLSTIVSISEGMLKVSQPAQFSHALLQQFTFNNDPILLETLLERLFELVDVCQKEIQVEIITSMPLLVTDKTVALTGDKLRDLLLRNSSLSAPVLDAFMALPLTEDLLSSIQECCLNLLESVGYDTVPVHLKFLLQSCPPGEKGMELLHAIRVKLTFPQSSSPNVVRKENDILMTSTPFEMPPPMNVDQNVRSKETDENSSVVISNVFSMVFQFRPTLAKSLLTALDSIQQSDGHRLTDFMLLVIVLHSHCIKADLIFTVLRHHIRREMLVESLLEEILFPHHNNFCEYHFKTLLQIGEHLLSEHARSPDLVSVGSCLYRQCFIHGSGLAEQQEVIAALVTHIGAGVSGEMTAALQVLMDLADQEPERMRRFDIFITGLLDQLDQLTAFHVRQLYIVLSKMAFK